MPYLLALTLLLTPTYVIKFNVFGFPPDVLMVWVVLVWVIFLGWILAKHQLREFWQSLMGLDKKILVLVGLFFLSGIISLFVHGFDRAKLGQFIVLFLQPVSIFFIGRFIIKQYPRATNYLLLTTYFLLAVTGLYAILQYFTLIGLPTAWWGNSNEPKRALSFFIHPNFYALWCAPLLAFLIPDIFSSFSLPLMGRVREGWKNWIKMFAWIIGATGLLLSLSRAGWAGLGAAVLVYLIFAADKKIRKIIFAGVIIMVIVIVCIPNLRWRFVLPFYGEKSAVSRFSLWDTGIKGVKESPIFGLGLTGFSRQWTTLNTDPGLTDTHNFPHNIFLDLWVETGLIGLISLIGLIGLYLYRGLRGASPPAKEGWIAKRDGVVGDFNRTIALSIALFLIAVLVQGQVDNPYFKNDLAMVFWIILSLAI